MKHRTFFGVIASIVVLLPGMSLYGSEPDKAKPTAEKPADQGELHTVEASVKTSSGTVAGTNVLAVKQPGSFTIRSGQVAKDFKYSFVDPKTGFESNKLTDSSIYCVTAKRWIKIPKDVKTLELPPGEYKFAVGGMPGAVGALTYTTIEGIQNLPPPIAPPGTPGTTVKMPPATEQPPTITAEPPSTTPDLVGRWSGTYTVEKVTGNVTGLGTVRGKRALGIGVERDASGMRVTGVVWIPPGWNGRAGGMNASGNSVWFNVTGQPMGGRTLVISFKGTVDANLNKIDGTLIGFLSQGNFSREVFQGSWKITRQ